MISDTVEIAKKMNILIIFFTCSWQDEESDRLSVDHWVSIPLPVFYQKMNEKNK